MISCHQDGSPLKLQQKGNEASNRLEICKVRTNVVCTHFEPIISVVPVCRRTQEAGWKLKGVENQSQFQGDC